MALQLVWMSGSGTPHHGEGSLCVSYTSGSNENLTFSGNNIDMTIKSGSQLIIGKEKTANPFYRFSHDGDISFSKAGTDKETVLRLKNEKLEVVQRSEYDKAVTATGFSDLIPEADDTYDIGSSAIKWQDLYIDGTAYLDNLNVGGDVISKSTISGSFTALSASIATDINNAGGITVETSIQNGSSNPVDGDAIFDALALKATIGGVKGDFLPQLDGTYDLGSSTKEWQDLYVDGTAYIDSLNVGGDVISKSTISGSFTVASSSFSTRVSANEVVTAKTLVSSSAQIASNISGSFTALSASIATDIGNAGGGTIDSSLSNSSTNAVRNSAVHAGLAAKQDTLTFGKISGNALKSEEALATNDVLLMGSSHVKGRTYSNFKSDLSLVKGDVGLGNVDNTTDANKPVSTATQTALNAKATTAAVTGDFLPSADNKWDLGSATKEWLNLHIDGTANIDRLDVDAVGTNLIPLVGAKKGLGQTLGNDKFRWGKIFLASSIDVSGSELVISAPSASAAGDDFNVVISGSIVAGDTDSGSIGTIEAPFKDLYVQSSSIYLSDMSDHGGKSWKQMSKSEKMARSTVFQKEDVDKLKRGESLNDSGIISASGDLFVSGSTKLIGQTEIHGVTNIHGLTDIRGGFRINGNPISEDEMRSLAGLTATTDELNMLDGIGTTAVHTQLAAKQATLNFGISSGYVIKAGSGIVDNDFLRIDGTTLEGLAASEVKTALSLVKGDVGLGNVDNTTDADKPVSTKTQTALSKKLDTVGGAMTGLVQEPFDMTDEATLLKAKGVYDARQTRVLQILGLLQSWTLTVATPAYRGQELTIIAAQTGTIVHTTPGKLTPAGSFVMANGKNLLVPGSTAVKFVANRQLYWIQIV